MGGKPPKIPEIKLPPIPHTPNGEIPTVRLEGRDKVSTPKRVTPPPIPKAKGTPPVPGRTDPTIRYRYGSTKTTPPPTFNFRITKPYPAVGPQTAARKNATSAKPKAPDHKSEVTPKEFLSEVKLQPEQGLLVGKNRVKILSFGSVSTNPTDHSFGGLIFFRRKKGEDYYFMRPAKTKGGFQWIAKSKGKKSASSVTPFNKRLDNKYYPKTGDTIIINGEPFTFFEPADAVKYQHRQQVEVPKEQHRQQVKQKNKEIEEARTKLDENRGTAGELIYKGLLEAKLEALKKLTLDAKRTYDGTPFSEATLQAVARITGPILTGKGKFKLVDGELPPASRNVIRARILAQLDEMGLQISTDNAKAVDSIIDVAVQAKKAGIIDERGGITQAELNARLAELYLYQHPDLRIAGFDLGHVPKVIEGTLKFGEPVEIAYFLRKQSKQEGPIDIPDITRAKTLLFLCALYHDSGKWPGVLLTTTQGMVLQGTANPLFNNTGVDIPVKPGETFPQAIDRITFYGSLDLKPETAKVDPEDVRLTPEEEKLKLKEIIDLKKKKRIKAFINFLEKDISLLKKVAERNGFKDEDGNLLLDKAKESLREDVSLLFAIKEKNHLKTLKEAADLLKNLPLVLKFGLMISIVAHHDSLTVFKFITETLVKELGLDPLEAIFLYVAIEAHGLISSFIGLMSLGEFSAMGLRTKVFDKPQYKPFVKLYLLGGEFTHEGETYRLEQGLAMLQLEGVDIFNSTDPVIQAAVSELPKVVTDLDPLSRAVMAGDNWANIFDPGKFIIAVKGSPKNKNASWHQLLLDRNARKDSIIGVTLTHRDEVHLIMPEHYADVVGPESNVALQWLSETNPTKPGLAQALLSDPKLKDSFEQFQKMWKVYKDMPDSIAHYFLSYDLEWDNSFHDWLRYHKALNDGKPSENFDKIQKLVDKAWYRFKDADKSEFNRLVAKERARMKPKADKDPQESGKILPFPTGGRKSRVSNTSSQGQQRPLRNAARRKSPTTIPPGEKKSD